MIDREEFVSELGVTHVVCGLAEDLRYTGLRHAFWSFLVGDSGRDKKKSTALKFQRDTVPLALAFFIRLCLNHFRVPLGNAGREVGSTIL
jgi:hypothetical protein